MDCVDEIPWDVDRDQKYTVTKVSTLINPGMDADSICIQVIVKG